MRYAAIVNKLKNRLYFTIDDLADILAIKPESTRVLCSRYAANGLFVRLKNNFYVLRSRWEGLRQEDFLKISNFLQVPSYVSFMAALSFYELTTQVRRSFFESACLKRSVEFQAGGAVFNYYKLKKEYYFGFIKTGGIFIATPEKAFVDSVYLYALGKYRVDFSSLDLKSLDMGVVRKILRVFPQKTKKTAKKICATL